MVNNLVFRWPKPLVFMVLGAHGIYTYICMLLPPYLSLNYSCRAGLFYQTHIMRLRYSL